MTYKPMEEDAVLELMERENRAFKNDPLWSQVGMAPDEFFAVVRQYASTVGIPKKQPKKIPIRTLATPSGLLKV